MTAFVENTLGKINTGSRRRIGFLCLPGLCLLLCAGASADQSVTLAWNPSTDPNVAGYFLCYGTNSGSYISQIDAGTNTTAKASGLREGRTYYFAFTAYNAQGLESDPSNEVSYIAPGILLLTAGEKAGDPMNLKFPVAPMHWYEVQATPDFQSWSTVWQTAPATSNDWVHFSEPRTNSARFYRLVLH
jgi:hypothetical protein